MTEPATEKDDQKEKRKLPSCRVAFSVGEERYTGSSSHFTEAGILVLCPHPAPLNMRLKLTLEFPDMEKPVEILGDVVWTNIHGPDDAVTPRGMGVKFSEEDHDAVRLVSDMALQFDNLDNIYQCYYT